ncbi:unnamed protein product [Ambrosiozyma monospora]|uniref:Unnamed protein product n=1 Tax=Ambrosiozyma monospora TaxID=43982 RepID=A0ACB5SR58_AMBMO|nr:unnamed protein product [Ambrosiozyma monospora]
MTQPKIPIRRSGPGWCGEHGNRKCLIWDLALCHLKDSLSRQDARPKACSMSHQPDQQFDQIMLIQQLHVMFNSTHKLHKRDNKLKHFKGIKVSTTHDQCNGGSIRA